MGKLVQDSLGKTKEQVLKADILHKKIYTQKRFSVAEGEERGLV